MSIRAGRLYLALAFVALLAGGAWLASAFALAGDWSASLAVPAALLLLAVVALAVGAPLMSRFVETRVADGSVMIRSVLARPRIIEMSHVDEVVVLHRLILPTRTGSSSSPRVLLRRGSRTIAAFTPRDLGVVDELRARGCTVTGVDEPLTPLAARRRYPGAVGAGELLAAAAPWLAIAVGVGVLLWVFVEAFGG